jgi:hypothetical protein
MKRMLAVVAGVVTLVALTPAAAHAEVNVSTPMIGLVNGDDLVAEATSPALTPPDPEGGNAGQYRCDLTAGGNFAYPDPSTHSAEIQYHGTIACTDMVRGIDMNAYLMRAFEGPYVDVAGPSRATCVDCPGPSPARGTYKLQNAPGATYFRVRVEYLIEFPQGHAWRFSPLCSPPSGNYVTCRKYADFGVQWVDD